MNIMDIVIAAAFVLFYVVLIRYALPRLGVPT